MSLTSSPSHDILTKLLKSSVDKAIYRKNSRSYSYTEAPLLLAPWSRG